MLRLDHLVDLLDGIEWILAAERVPPPLHQRYRSAGALRSPIERGFEMELSTTTDPIRSDLGFLRVTRSIAL